MTVSELTALLNKLRPLASDKMTVDVPPPRATRFGTPLVLSRVHWVRPELVAEVTYLTWTVDGLLRHVVYEGLREDKSPRDVGRAAGGSDIFVRLRASNAVDNRAVLVDFQKGRMHHMRINAVADNHRIKCYKHLYNTLGVAGLREAEITSA
jgi:hypothetical protein